MTKANTYAAQYAARKSGVVVSTETETNPTPAPASTPGRKFFSTAKAAQVALSQPPAIAPAPVTGFTGTAEQQAYWNVLANGTSHTILQAVAGSGKTTAIVHGALAILAVRPKDRIGVVAFNKLIAEELTARFAQLGETRVYCVTYNSLGYSAVRSAFPRIQMDTRKLSTTLRKIADQMMSAKATYDDKRAIIQPAEKLVELTGINLKYDVDADVAEEWFGHLADRYGIDLPSLAFDREMVFEFALEAISECMANTLTCDFSDQINWPAAKGLPVRQFDELFVDEAQDTCLSQQELAMLSIGGDNGKGRIHFVGDPYQAIYGFRGADSESMPRMSKRLASIVRGVQVMPLSQTRRNPKKVVGLAQVLVPHIQPLDTAPDGVIMDIMDTELVGRVQPGDMVLCRTNAPLCKAVLATLKTGKKAILRGRDFGGQLSGMVTQAVARIKRLSESNISAADMRALQVIETLQDVYNEEMDKAIEAGAKQMDKQASRLALMQDKIECIETFAYNLDKYATPRDLTDYITSMFADSADMSKVVSFSSVHRAKGLESYRVFVLRPELMPHPKAKSDWEMEQEKNLKYVAMTRVKFLTDRETGEVREPGTLVWVITSEKPRQGKGPGLGDGPAPRKREDGGY